MKHAHLIAAGLVASAGIASAQDAATPAATEQPKSGSIIQSSTGNTLGRVEYLDQTKGGPITGVALIYDGHMIHIPASTLTATGKNHFATSLTRKQLEP